MSKTAKQNPEVHLLAILRAIEKHIGGETPMHQALVFFTVAAAAEAGIDMRDIARATGLSPSSVSRNVAALGEWHRLKRPGLGLLETREDRDDRRRKLVWLSAKGKRVLKSIHQSST